ncbi:probable beta-D-xylosidase 7 [Tanacetum coccineum]
MGKAKRVDHVVLVIGLDQSRERKKQDRVELGLPGKQEDLVSTVAKAAKNPVLLVLLCGSLVDVSFAKADAKNGLVILVKLVDSLLRKITNDIVSTKLVTGPRPGSICGSTHIHVLGDGAQMLGFPCLNGKDPERMRRIYGDGDALHILRGEMGKGETPKPVTGQVVRVVHCQWSSQLMTGTNYFKVMDNDICVFGGRDGPKMELVATLREYWFRKFLSDMLQSEKLSSYIKENVADFEYPYGKPLALPWGRTPRLNSGVRVRTHVMRGQGQSPHVHLLRAVNIGRLKFFITVLLTRSLPSSRLFFSLAKARVHMWASANPATPLVLSSSRLF